LCILSCAHAGDFLSSRWFDSMASAMKKPAKTLTPAAVVKTATKVSKNASIAPAVKTVSKAAVAKATSVDVKTQSKAAIKPATKPATKLASKPIAKQDSKAATKAVAKPATKAVVKNATLVKAAAKSSPAAAKVVGKIEVAKDIKAPKVNKAAEIISARKAAPKTVGKAGATTEKSAAKSASGKKRK